MNDAPNVSAGAQGVSPREVMGGFWVRALALVLDIILLNFVFNGLSFLFREQFFLVSRYTDFIGMIIVYLYFTLLNGPVGKGRTMGMYLFNICVRDYEGCALSLGAACKRTLIQMVSPLFPMVFFTPFLKMTEPSQAMLSGGILSLSLSFLVSNALLVGLHPLKQGFHDRVARSIVVRGQIAVRYEELERFTSSEMIGRKIRTPASAYQSAGIAFVVISLIQIWGVFQQVRSEPWRIQSHMLDEMRQRFSIQGLELTDFGVYRIRDEVKEESAPPARSNAKQPEAKLKESEVAATSTLAKQPVAKLKEVEVATTSTLAKQPVAKLKEAEVATTSPLAQKKERFRFFVKYTSRRDISEKDVKEIPRLSSFIHELRDWSLEKLKTDYAPMLRGPEGEKTGQESADASKNIIWPEDCQVYFVETYSLFIFTHSKTEASYILPWQGTVPLVSAK